MTTTAHRTHTPTPWVAFIGGSTIAVHDEHGRPVVQWNGFDSSDFKLRTQAANARLIVRAVNAHDDLVAACKRALDVLSATTAADDAGDDEPVDVSWLNAAIARAEGR